MEENVEKARKANIAASAISDAMSKKLSDMTPGIAAKYELDEQLVRLAIAQAAVEIAATAASEATGMGAADAVELEDRLHAVVFAAMNQLLTE